MLKREVLALWSKSILLPAIITLFYALAPYGFDYDIHRIVYRRIDFSQLPEDQKAAAKDYFAKVSFRDLANDPSKADEATRQMMIEDGTQATFKRLEIGLYLSLIPFAILFVLPFAINALKQGAEASEQALLNRYRLAWYLTVSCSIVNVLLLTALFVYGLFSMSLVVFHFYSPPILAMLAVLSVLVIWRSLNALLRRIPNEVREPEGAELVGGELFEAFRPVNDIAARLNVASPQHILAGFHYCFYYVTELPVLHMGVKTTGRSLYVPSLVNKHLTYEEQKAILAHELAHYRSSGRSMTAEFFPLHRRIYVVTHALNLNGLIGKSNLHLIRYFYTSFEPIIRAMMARREFEADATAAGVTSRETLAKALVKIQALAKILEDLGEWIAENPNVPLSSLDLRAVGKEDFSTDQGFWEAVLNERMHHPLDNHPPLKERLHALGFALTGEHVRVITLEG